MRISIFRKNVADFFPGYFALVMATGIISVAAHLQGMERAAIGLLGFNLAAYVILWLLTLLRLVLYPGRLIDDLTSHHRGPGFFTLVAGTCVLGSNLLIVRGATNAAAALCILGVVLWAVVMYTFLTAVTIREDKPTLETGINGAWLIATVATQSVSILGVLLSSHVEGQQPVVLFACLSLYLLGCMLYLSIITLIFYRFTFVRLSAEALTPPYWINMGAVAITTLAGATLMLRAPEWPFLFELLPFLRGFTLFFWATSTWWIPFLVILGIWRHGRRRFPLTYDPQYWGMVFPLGMYTVATLQLARATELEFLLPIPRVFIWFAFAAWTGTAAGLMRRLGKEGYRILIERQP